MISESVLASWPSAQRSIVTRETMRIEYQSDIDDMLEPYRRSLKKSRFIQKKRVCDALWGFLGVSVGAYVATRKWDTSTAIFFSLTMGGIGGIISYCVFDRLALRSQRKVLEKQYEGKLPTPVVYTFEGNTLICDFQDLVFRFDISQLSYLHQDDQGLDIWFGDLQNCFIPNGAFESDELKREFVERLHPELG